MRIIFHSTFLFLYFSFCFCNVADQFGNECRYKGDMGKINPECIRRMRDQRVLIRECYGIYYGLGLLYDDRGDVPFRIGIEDDERKYFPEDFTYTIYRKIGEYNEPGSLTWVENCKSVALNSRCILPKRKEGETFFMYFPVIGEDDWFCEFRIHEYPSAPHFCKDEQEFQCLEIVNGVTQYRNALVPLSRKMHKLKSRYCFVPVSESRQSNFSAGEYVYDVPGIEKRGRHVSFHDSHTKVSCANIRNSNGTQIIRLAERSLAGRSNGSDGFCFFVKVSKISRQWLKTPVCYRNTVNQVISLPAV